MSPRVRLALLLLLLVGAPFLVTFSLLSSRAYGPVVRADQPGGRIDGTVLDPTGVPLADVEVELVLVTDPPVGASHAEVAERTRTDHEGRFSFEAPSHRGAYELRAGGGPWRKVAQGFTFVDGRGRKVEPEPVEFDLQPGAILTVEIERRRGGPLAGGEWELRGHRSERTWLRWFEPELVTRGRFQGTRLTIGGLPPLGGTLTLRLDGGDVVTLPVELSVGETFRHIDL